MTYYNICSGNAWNPPTQQYNYKTTNISDTGALRIGVINTTTIADLANSMNPDKDDRLHVRFKENNGTSLYDVSGNNNNGTISGATWNNDSVFNLVPTVSYTFSNLFNFTLLDSFYDKVAGYFTFNDDTTPPTITVQSPTNTTYNSVARTLNYLVTDNGVVDTCWYQYNGTNTTIIKYNISNDVLYSNDGISTIGSTPSYIKIATINLNLLNPSPTSIRVYFELESYIGAVTAYGRIYKNGIPIGTETYDTSSEWAIYTEDLSFSQGDTVELWGRTSIGGSARYRFLRVLGINNPSCVNTTFTALNNQQSTLILYANDSAGNMNSTNISFSIDSLPPAITVLSPINNSNYSSASIWFNLTLSETGSWAGYSLDGAANKSLSNDTGNWNLKNASMTQGQHSVVFFANDSAGNMNVSEPNITFTVDTIKPNMSAYYLSGTDFVQGQAVSLFVNASDATTSITSTFTLKYPAGTQFNYTMALLNGTSVNGFWNYTISTDVCAADYFTIPYIYATDSAGNVQANATSLTFIIRCPYQVLGVGGGNTGSGTGGAITNQSSNQSINASIQNNIPLPQNISIKGGIQNITTPMIIVNPEKIVMDATKDTWIKATVELKNVDNITHILTLSSSNAYFIYSEIYDIPMTVITLAPKEAKNILVSVFVKNNDTIVFNVLENNMAIGRFYIYPTVKNELAVDIFGKISRKLSYPLELSTTASNSITSEKAVVHSRVDATITIFGAVIFVALIGFLAGMIRLMFSTLYKNNKTLYMGVVLGIAVIVLIA